MAERNDGRRSPGEELIEVPRNPKYDALFGKILEVSRKRGESSTRNAGSVSIRIPPDSSIISVTVNPCFADEKDRPVFLTLDAYVDGLHVQQIAARAFWSPLDVPTSEIDPTRVGVNRRQFDEESLAGLGLLAMSSLDPEAEGVSEEVHDSPPRDSRFLN